MLINQQKMSKYFFEMKYLEYGRIKCLISAMTEIEMKTSNDITYNLCETQVQCSLKFFYKRNNSTVK